MGSVLGVVWAKAKGAHWPTWGFYMGSNWFMLSLPFFTIRDASLGYCRWRNVHRGVSDMRRIDQDELLSSVMAGSMVGSWAGYLRSI